MMLLVVLWLVMSRFNKESYPQKTLFKFVGLVSPQGSSGGASASAGGPRAPGRCSCLLVWGQKVSFRYISFRSYPNSFFILAFVFGSILVMSISISVKL